MTIDFPPSIGGVANYWSNLARHMPANDFVVLANDMENTIDFDMKQSYLIYRKNLISKNRWIWPKWVNLLYHTYKIIKQENIENVIVTHVLPCGTVAYLLKKILKIDYFVSLHGLDISNAAKTAKKRKLAKKVLRGAKAIIVNSQFTADLLKRKLGCIKCSVNVNIIHPCPNIVYRKIDEEKLDSFVKDSNLSGKRMILTVSRLIERKGHDMVLHAMQKVINRFPDLVYAIVGKGPQEKKLKELTSSLNLKNNVKFFSDIQDNELPYFYKASDLFIMPTRELEDGDIEGFGIVYLEANSFGKPVIAGSAGGAVEAVVHNSTGLVVGPENVNEIAQGIISLLTNKDRAYRMGDQGIRRVEDGFTWDRQGGKLEKLLG